MNAPLKLWVWDSDFSRSMDEWNTVIVYAASEEEAWDQLKREDKVIWWYIRGRAEDRNDPRTPEEIPKDRRPRLVTKPEVFVNYEGY